MSFEYSALGLGKLYNTSLVTISAFVHLHIQGVNSHRLKEYETLKNSYILAISGMKEWNSPWSTFSSMRNSIVVGREYSLHRIATSVHGVRLWDTYSLGVFATVDHDRLSSVTIVVKVFTKRTTNYSCQLLEVPGSVIDTKNPIMRVFWSGAMPSFSIRAASALAIHSPASAWASCFSHQVKWQSWPCCELT